MPPPVVNQIEGVSVVNSSIVCMARIVSQVDGSYPDVSGFSSACYSINDTSTYPTTIITESTPLSPISTYFLSIPIVNRLWTYDDVGYNFFLTIPSNILSDFNHAYVIVVAVVDVNNNNFSINFRDITIQGNGQFSGDDDFSGSGTQYCGSEVNFCGAT